MVIVVACFVVCWFPLSVSVVNAFFDQRAAAFLAVNSSLLTMIAYVNMVANPIIYGVHFDALRRFSGALCRRFAKNEATETSFGEHSAGGQRFAGYRIHIARLKAI
jgi:hypothetical protein